MKKLDFLLKYEAGLFNISFKKCVAVFALFSIFLLSAFITKINFISFTHTNPVGAARYVNLPHFEASYGLPVPHNHKFEGIVQSRVSQKVMLSIRIDDYFDSLYINGEYVSLEFLRERYNRRVLDHWHAAYKVPVELSSGVNTISLYTRDIGGGYGFSITRTFLVREVLFSILFLILPLGYLAIMGVLWAAKNREKIFSRKVSSKLPLLIVLVGAVLRVMLFATYGNKHYQHDYHSHIEYIKFVANNLTLPEPQKSLQFPQQPLYYITTAALYNVAQFFGAEHAGAMKVLGVFSIFASFMFLWGAYRIAYLIFKKNHLRIIFLGIISLTPSLIYLAARINNDVLVAVFSIWAIYYMFKYFNFTQSNKHFYKMLAFLVLAVFTKLSSAAVPFSIFIFLLYRAFTNPAKKESSQKELKRFAWFSVAFTIVFSIIFFRAYIPEKGEFLFILSAAFKNQTIESVDTRYFMSFNFLSLFDNAQSHVFGNDEVRFSYPTFQFGTAFFGEYNYTRLHQEHGVTKPLMRAIYLFGLVLLVSFLGYFAFASSMPFIYKGMILMPALNFILNAFAIYEYPSVCNSDFRYHIAIISIFVAIISFGFDKIYNKFLWLRPVMAGSIVVLFTSQVIWMLIMIFSGTPGTLF